MSITVKDLVKTFQEWIDVESKTLSDEEYCELLDEIGEFVVDTSNAKKEELSKND
jgi:hypothetical protein